MKVLVVAFVTLALGLLAFESAAQTWQSLNSGLICEQYGHGLGYQFDVDPATGYLHVAGLFFHNFECDTMRSVVFWDGANWRPHARPSGATIRTVKNYGGQLYAHVFHEGSYRLGRLNESNAWESVSELTNNMAIYKLREIDGDLYGAGSFNELGPHEAALLFRWDGENMEALIDTLPASLMIGYEVYKYQEELYVGGRFSFFDSQAFAFGRVRNKRVEGFGILQGSTVFAMEEHEGLLYIGGAFRPEQFGTDSWTRLLVFDGETIKPYPLQPNAGPRKLISYNGYLYVAGQFTEFNGEPAHGVVRINQFGYEILNTDSLFRFNGVPAHNQGNSINDALILNDSLYITGNFGRIGSHENLNCVAKLNMALSAQSEPLMVDGVNLFPNPSTGSIYLEAQEFFTHGADLRIYTANGKLLRIEHWPAYTRRKEIERGALSRGLYLIELLADDQRKTFRWVLLD
jgi:hypothetical protein